MPASAPSVLVWFRYDLRVHDHAPLLQAAQLAASGIAVVPVYVVEPAWLGSGYSGMGRTGPFRWQYIRAALAGLDTQLRQLGSRLLVVPGPASTVLPQLAAQYGATAVLAHTEPAWEEQQAEAALRTALAASGIALHLHQGGSLYFTEDLPFPTHLTDDHFAAFKNEVERSVLVRLPKPAPPPGSLTPHPAIPQDAPLDLSALPLPEFKPGMQPDSAALPAGETEALARLHHCVWDSALARHYRHTRNGLSGTAFSTRLGAALAQGCLSPRRAMEELRSLELRHGPTEGTQGLYHELLWREYFRLMAAKHGAHLFGSSGPRRVPIAWLYSDALLQAWCQGATGYPIVDAAMRELAATGWISNRARMLAASLLTRNLGLDWRLGAAWFEYWLADYDPCSNYGNWNHVAGTGFDPRGFHFLHPARQAEKFDPKAEYIQQWLPQLASLPPQAAWDPSPAQRKATGYPEPVLNLVDSATTCERMFRKALIDGNHKRASSRIRKFVK